MDGAGVMQVVGHFSMKEREYGRGVGYGEACGACDQKHLHAKLRKRVGNNIVGALCRHCKIVFSSQEKEATEELHYVRVTGGARH